MFGTIDKNCAFGNNNLPQNIPMIMFYEIDTANKTVYVQSIQQQHVTQGKYKYITYIQKFSIVVSHNSNRFVLQFLLRTFKNNHQLQKCKN